MGRFTLIAVALVASLILVGFLAWQAHEAVTSHRQTAESVLQDYAQLASSEFVRRTLTEVGYYGYFPLVNALRSWLAENAARELVDPASLPGDEDQQRARELASYILVYDHAERALRSSSPGPSAAVVAELVSRLGAAAEEGVATDGSYVTLFAEVEGEMRTFVYAPVDLGAAKPDRLLGFEVDRQVLGSWIEVAVGRGPLLPVSLVGEEFSNASIFLEVLLSDGQVLYSNGEAYDPWYGVEVPFGQQYRGTLEEVTVRLALDPEVAPELVIGGLPRSRLPLLLGVLVLVAGLVLVSLLQFRRERELIQLRSDFVSRVSHELRTPLTQIRMFAETLLLERDRNPNERRRALEIVDRESRRLSHLVENVLQFSRSEHDTIQLVREPRLLAPLLGELVEEFSPLLDGRDARVVTRVEGNPRVAVDEDAMRQIVLNLLENAVKYGPDEHEVQLGTTLANGSVRVWVDDQGPGVPAAERERVWEPFQRLDTERTSNMTGTGIGLSVVRELVARHGGQTWVEDGARGGARFIFELPISESGGGEVAG